MNKNDIVNDFEFNVWLHINNWNIFDQTNVRFDIKESLFCPSSFPAVALHGLHLKENAVLAALSV